MKRHITLINIFCFLALFFIASPAHARTANDTIIAIVNKEAITLKDLHDYLSTIYVQLSSEGKSEDEIKAVMVKYQNEGLNRLIEDKLLVDEANRKELKVRDKAVDDRLEEVKRNYPSEDDFLKAIVQEGLTVTELKKRISDQLKAKYIVEMEVKSKIFVNPSEVTDHYKEHINDFMKPERVDLDSIFIPYAQSPMTAKETSGNPAQYPDNQKVAQEKANEALAALKAGQDFLETAKKYSRLPPIGIVARGQMILSIENAIFGLKTGEVSEPIKAANGIFIFKLKAELPAETAALDEVKDKIYNALFNQKFQKRLSLWIDDLKKKAYVEIKN